VVECVEGNIGPYRLVVGVRERFIRRSDVTKLGFSLAKERWCGWAVKIGRVKSLSASM
jgi:hypothetical protein